MRIERVNNVIKNKSDIMSIYGTLFTVTNGIQAVGDKCLKDITMRQQFLLTCLDLFDDYNPSLHELARVFGSSYQNIKKISKQLEDEGYLEIRKDSLDRRKLRIILNKEKFAEHQEALTAKCSNFSNSLMNGISNEEKMILQKTLLKMENNLSKIEENLEDLEEF